MPSRFDQFGSLPANELAKAIFAGGDGIVLILDADRIAGDDVARLIETYKGVCPDFLVVGTPGPWLDAVEKSDAPVYLFGDRVLVTTGDGTRVGAAKRQEFPISLLKASADDEERFVFGVVLEPDTEDAHGDIYSASEVRKAAHWYMENGRQFKLQHRTHISDQITLLESFIAPADFDIGGQTVKAGTWMMAVRVNDEKLWKSVKEGKFTGFSIGGTAVRHSV